MDIPFTHRDPRFTMWSKSPSMLINLPSRTVATMPQPHEQKLQEVVNSLTFESFSICVLARTASTSTKALSASPAQPPAAVLNHSLRVTPVEVFDDSTAAFPICSFIPRSSFLVRSKACSVFHESGLQPGNEIFSLAVKSFRNNHFVQKDQRHVIGHSVHVGGMRLKRGSDTASPPR